MVRTKSEDKRQAILEAAIALFAERGLLSTPTSAISKAAAVAEGTLFTYFPTKDELMNELYRMLKRELSEQILGGLPWEADIRRKLHHLWDRYVTWGVANPQRFAVMTQLRSSGKLTADTLAIGNEPFAEIETMTRESVAAGELRDYPVPFLAALLGGLAETIMAFIAQHPIPTTHDYSALGFEVLWNGIANTERKIR